MKKEYSKQINNEVFTGIKKLVGSLKLPKLQKKDPDVNEAAVSDDTDIPEFQKRYKNAQISTWASLAITLYCYYLLFTVENPFAALVTTLSCVMFTMFYITQSYTCWRARTVAQNWSSRHIPLTTTYAEFFVKISSKPSELFPTSLKFKQ
ncbi:hypothetical protein [Vibrio harveyi]|uniref:hypothetical protein n=1 Tax=Vibrio harveyi TaxID=669 RepID=UPI003CEB0632